MLIGQQIIIWYLYFKIIKIIWYLCFIELFTYNPNSHTSKETDGLFNEEYCKWCYADGEHMYHYMYDLIEISVNNMANEDFPFEQAPACLWELLPKLGTLNFLVDAAKFVALSVAVTTQPAEP